MPILSAATKRPEQDGMERHVFVVLDARPVLVEGANRPKKTGI